MIEREEKMGAGGMHKCCGEGKGVSFHHCREMSQSPGLINLASFLGAPTSVSQ